jgi:hypothetical protein
MKKLEIGFSETAPFSSPVAPSCTKLKPKYDILAAKQGPEPLAEVGLYDEIMDTPDDFHNLWFSYRVLRRLLSTTRDYLVRRRFMVKHLKKVTPHSHSKPEVATSDVTEGLLKICIPAQLDREGHHKWQ